MCIDFINEFSDGPFGYQRRVVTGTYPIFTSIHEEPQTQFTYSLKADYVHFSFFSDFDRLVIGEGKYKWNSRDLEGYDDRMNENGHILAGFDYGGFAIGLRLSEIQYGFRHDDIFVRGRLATSTYDILYKNRFFETQLFFGRGSESKPSEDEKPIDDDVPEEIKEAERIVREREAQKPNYYGEITFVRYNILFDSYLLSPMFSLIYRKFKFYREKDMEDQGEVMYKSSAFTAASYINYIMGEDISLSSYISYEHKTNDSGVTDYSEHVNRDYLKAGVNIALSF